MKALFFWKLRSGIPFSEPRIDCKGWVVGMGLGRLERDPFSNCGLSWVDLGPDREGNDPPNVDSNLWRGSGGSGISLRWKKDLVCSVIDPSGASFT